MAAAIWLSVTLAFMFMSLGDIWWHIKESFHSRLFLDKPGPSWPSSSRSTEVTGVVETAPRSTVGPGLSSLRLGCSGGCSAPCPRFPQRCPNWEAMFAPHAPVLSNHSVMNKVSKLALLQTQHNCNGVFLGCDSILFVCSLRRWVLCISQLPAPVTTCGFWTESCRLPMPIFFNDFGVEDSW